MPDVVGQDAGERADRHRGRAGFIVGAITGQSSAAVPAGIVMSSGPGRRHDRGFRLARQHSSCRSGRRPGELDLDGDGFTGNQGDCNDTNAAINPAAFDVPGDGIDQNCNGVDSIAGDNGAADRDSHEPADLAEVTMPTDIVGTATDANFLRYTLTFAEVDATTCSRRSAPARRR